MNKYLIEKECHQQKIKMLNKKNFSTYLLLVFVLQILSTNLFNFCLANTFSQEVQPSGSQVKDYFVLTQPKAGTHILMKLLDMLTGKKPKTTWDAIPQLNVFNFVDNDSDALAFKNEIEKQFRICKKDNRYPLAHLNFSELYHNFSLDHPEFVKIILIRDLRDVCVSCAFFQSKTIEKKIGSSNFDDILLYVIKLDCLAKKNKIFNTNEFAIRAIKWTKDPEAVICRFEDLVGIKGGGSLKAQERLITEIAYRLNVSLTSDKLGIITSNLFGKTKNSLFNATFREGQIGSWKHYFNEEHKRAFNEMLGDSQIALGYPICE